MNGGGNPNDPNGSRTGARQGRPPMRGGSGRRPGDGTPPSPFSYLSTGAATAPAKSATPPPLPKAAERPPKNVLFVCIGNAARSQMAEAFARTYGSDVIIPQSAGTNPATMLAPFAVQLLEEKNIKTDAQFPKGLEIFREPFDLIVNMSGKPLAIPATRTVEWTVADPGGLKEDAYRTAADQIEGLVMRLILELRTAP
jgi:protein-tyrosine-phosphatase